MLPGGPGAAVTPAGAGGPRRGAVKPALLVQHRARPEEGLRLGKHCQGLAALANVSGHELSEALTDPHGDAWYDSSGNENSDKCAWTFSGRLITFTNGSQWKIQGNWSNNAYTFGGSYLGAGSGCIDGN